MFKKMHRIVASAKEPVLAAVDGVSKKYVLAYCQCPNPDCGSKFVTNNTAAPLCVTCSTPMKKIMAETVTLPAHQIISEMPKIGKCQCGTTFHATKELQASLAGKANGYCVVCSDEITFDEAAAEDTTDIPMDDEFNFGDEEAVDTSDTSDTSEDGSDSEFEDADLAAGDSDEFADDGGSALDFPEDDEIDAAAAPAPAAQQPAQAAPVPAPAPAPAPVAENPPPAAEPASVPSDEEEPVPAPSESDGPGADAADEALQGVNPVAASARVKKVKVNSLTAFLKNQASVKSVEITMSAGETPKWWLFADSRPVAFATEAKANDRVKAIFQTPNFARAFQTAAEEGLTPEVVQDFGFEPVQTEMPVDQATQQAVDTAVADATTDLNSKVEEVAALFENCLGVAAVGGLKGIVPVENPLQTAVAAELARLGDPNSSITAQNIFKTNGEQFLRNIVAQAKVLTQKSTPALAELSQIVADADFRETLVKKPSVRQAPIMVPAEFQDQTNGDYPAHGERQQVAASLTDDGIRSMVRGVAQRSLGGGRL